MGVARKAPMPEPWDRNGSLAEAFRAASANSSDARNRNFKSFAVWPPKAEQPQGSFARRCTLHCACVTCHVSCYINYIARVQTCLCFPLGPETAQQRLRVSPVRRTLEWTAQIGHKKAALRASSSLLLSCMTLRVVEKVETFSA